MSTFIIGEGEATSTGEYLYQNCQIDIRQRTQTTNKEEFRPSKRGWKMFRLCILKRAQMDKLKNQESKTKELMATIAQWEKKFGQLTKDYDKLKQQNLTLEEEFLQKQQRLYFQY